MLFIQYALHHAWLIPLLPAVAFVLVGFFLRRLPTVTATVSLLLNGLSLVLALGVAGGVISRGISVEQPLLQKVSWLSLPGLSVDMGVYIDPISAMMLVVVTLVSFLVQMYSIGYMHGEEGFGRFFAYLSLFAASMLGLVLAVNFVQMFVFWELVGLCSYLLIGYYFHKISAREAAKKAFITTRIGDFGLLMGILFLQILFGTLDFQQLGLAVPTYVAQNGTVLLTGVALLIFLGPVGKSGQFPLHVWLPDAMEGPTPVSALIHAATMVVAGVYLVARSFFLFNLLPSVMDAVAWTGAFTAIFAASIAFTQRDIKRILAYSTVSQLGYMMLALGVGSLTASMFHLMTHAFFKALMFLAAGAVLHGLPNRNDIFEMGGLRHKMPVTFAAMTIGVLAISGIPPFAGFFSKDEILLAAFDVSLPLFTVALITSCMTSFYMARLLIVVFCGPEKSGNHPHEAPLSMRIPLFVLGALAVVGGYAGYAGHFGEWVRFGAASHAGIHWGIAGASTLLALAAFGIAWKIYGSGSRKPAEQLTWRFRNAYNLSFHKYYLDEWYQWFNESYLGEFARNMHWMERNIIDSVINGIAAVPLFMGDRLRKMQTGSLQRYGVVMFCAALLIVVSLLVLNPLLKGVWFGGAC